MAKVRETLAAFQEEFQERIKILGDDLHSQMDDEQKVFRETWDHNHKRM